MHGSLVAVFLQLMLCTALSKPQEQLEHRRYSRQHFPVDSLKDPADQQEPHLLWKRSILDKPNHVPSPLSATNSSLVKRSDGKAAAATAAAGGTVDLDKSAHQKNQTAKPEDPTNAEMLSHLQKRYVSKNAQNKKKKGMRKKMRGRKKMHRQGNRRNKDHSKRNAEDEKSGDPAPGHFNDRSSGLLMEESSSHLMKRKLLEKKESSKSPGTRDAGPSL